MASKGKSLKGSKSQSRANLQLVKAMEKSDLEALKKCLESTKVNTDINSLVKVNSTPLIFASRKGKLTVVEYLAKVGALLDVRNDEGESAVMVAASHGNVDVAQFLALQGADLEIINDEGKTAVLLAAEQGHIALAQTLANIQLVKAVESNLEAVKKCIESAKANADINCLVKDNSGTEQTPLMYASRRGDLLVVGYLEQAGAPPTPLLLSLPSYLPSYPANYPSAHLYHHQVPTWT